MPQKDAESEVTEVCDNVIAAVPFGGVLTMIAAGSVTIIVTWTDGNNTTCVTAIIIADSSDPDVLNPPVAAGITVINRLFNKASGVLKNLVWNRKDDVIDQVGECHFRRSYFFCAYRIITLFLIFSAYLYHRPPSL